MNPSSSPSPTKHLVLLTYYLILIGIAYNYPVAVHAHRSSVSVEGAIHLTGGNVIMKRLVYRIVWFIAEHSGVEAVESRTQRRRVRKEETSPLLYRRDPRPDSHHRRGCPRPASADLPSMHTTLCPGNRDPISGDSPARRTTMDRGLRGTPIVPLVGQVGYRSCRHLAHDNMQVT
jgi:hypothetical protein